MTGFNPLGLLVAGVWLAGCAFGWVSCLMLTRKPTEVADDTE